MTARQQWITVGAVVFALGVLFAVLMYSMRDDLRAVGAGSDAPNFHAKVLGENAYKSLGDYSGRVLVVNFWASRGNRALVTSLLAE